MTENPEQKLQSEGTKTPVDPPPPMIIEPLAPPYRVVIYFEQGELQEKLDAFWETHGENIIKKLQVKTQKRKGGAQPNARKLIEKKFRPSQIYGEVLSRIVTEKVEGDIMFLEGVELFNYPPSKKNPWPQLVSVIYFVPELKMNGTINWAVKHPPIPPEEEEWGRRQLEVQRQHRIFEPDEGGVDVTEGHQVFLDVTASIEGEPYVKGTFQGQWLEVEVVSIPELKAALLEHKKGDLFEVSFTQQLDPEVAGKTVDASVKVHDLKIIRTPEVDDDLAKDAGYGDLVDFRKRFHTDYVKYLQNARQATATDHVLGQIMMQSRVPAFPEEWVGKNIERLIARHLEQFKGDLKKGMAALGVPDKESFEQSFKGQLYREYMQQLAVRAYCKMYEIEEPGSDEMFESILSQVKWIKDEEKTVERVGS